VFMCVLRLIFGATLNRLKKHFRDGCSTTVPTPTTCLYTIATFPVSSALSVNEAAPSE